MEQKRREHRESCVILEGVKGGSVGLKCRSCLKLCPPCNPHLVTTASDTVLKSEPFPSLHRPLPCVRRCVLIAGSSHPVFPPPPTALVCCSETVPASLWRLGLDCQGLGTVQLTAPWLVTDQTLPVLKDALMRSVCVCAPCCAYY